MCTLAAVSAGLLTIKALTNSVSRKACFSCVHCEMQGSLVYLDEEVDEPGSDASPDNVHEEIADGKQPGIWILQALLSQ